MGYEPSADTTAKLISLAREEEKAADAIVAAPSPAVKQKIDALVRLIRHDFQGQTAAPGGATASPAR